MTLRCLVSADRIKAYFMFIWLIFSRTKINNRKIVLVTTEFLHITVNLPMSGIHSQLNKISAHVLKYAYILAIPDVVHVKT